MDFLAKFLQPWRLFNSTSCKRFHFDHFIRNEKFLRSSHPKFPRARLTPGNFSESRQRFTSGSWKNRKMKPSQLFTTCARISALKMTRFQLFRPEWKLIYLLKQKWKHFVKENRQKWKMDHFDSIWPQISSSEMKTRFSRFPSRNLTQTNVFHTFRLTSI